MVTKSNSTTHTKGADAVFDALGSPISNGSTYPRPKVRSPKPKQGFGPIVIKQPAFGNWRCDGCGTKGSGLRHLQRHNTNTGHTIFTDLDYAASHPPVMA